MNRQTSHHPWSRASAWARLMSLAALAAGALALTTSQAHARDVHFSVGVQAPGVSLGVSSHPPVYYAPPPVYYAPPPVYYAPPPVYHRGVRPVVVVPPPIYYDDDRGHRRHWKHKHDRHHRHDHDGRRHGYYGYN